MVIPEKLKLNKFKEVAIPSKGEYMARFGAINTPQQMSGDQLAPASARTTDIMREFDQFDQENMVKHTKVESSE